MNDNLRLANQPRRIPVTPPKECTSKCACQWLPETGHCENGACNRLASVADLENNDGKCGPCHALRVLGTSRNADAR